MRKIDQNKLIVRYRYGTPIYIVPDLQEKLKKQLKLLKQVVNFKI